MKRVTFVFIGVLAITAMVLATQNDIEEQSVSIIKVDAKKHSVPGIFD